MSSTVLPKSYRRKLCRRMALVMSLALGAVLVLSQPAHPTQAEKKLTSSEVLADLRILRRSLEEVHPGFGRYETVESTQALISKIEEGLADGSTDAELYLEVSRILAHLRCDHTKAELPESLEAFRTENPSYLPFTFRLFGDRMFVDQKGEIGALQRGDEITSINGYATKVVLAQVAELVSIDGYTDDTRYVEMENSSEYLGDAVDHFWPFLFGWPTSWELEVERGTDKLALEASPVTYEQWLELASSGERYVNFPDTVRYEQLNESTGYLSIGTFVNYRKPVLPSKVFDPIFDQVQADGVSRLILDLRNCGGGSDDVPASLATYLSAKRVKTAKRLPWVKTYRFGDLEEHLQTWDKSVFSMPEKYFTDLGNGFFEMDTPQVVPRVPTRKNQFEGDLVILSSAANASGATMFIALAQEHFGARVVGEPTGGSVEGPTAGVIFTLKLPASGIKVRVPGIRSWLNVSKLPQGKGVAPDVVVRPDAEDWLAGKDPVLEAALQLGSATATAKN